MSSPVGYGDAISVEQPAAGPGASSRLAALLRRFDDASDRLSPIVVKEVRQIVRGREFNYSFMVSLVVGLLVAFFGAASASSGVGTTGQSVFVALTACLALLGIGIVPFGAFSALRNERLEQTMDLITVTSLSARKVIVGKLLAQAVKLATLFAGMAPFVATSFLLGGIDFVSIVVSLALVFLASVWMCAAALLGSSLAKTRGVSGALLAGGAFLVLLLFFGGFGIVQTIVFTLIGVRSGGAAVAFGAPSGAQGWWMLLLAVTLGAASLVNLVLLAENRLSSPVENKSTALRIGFFVQFLAIIAAFTAIARFSSLPRAVEPLAVFGLLHLAVVAAFTVTEEFSVPRRVLRRIQATSRWSAWTILWPGGGRGAAYVLVQMVLLIAVVRYLSVPGVGWVAAACGYICFVTGVPAVVLRWARPRLPAFYLRIAILVVVSASLVIPDVLYYLVAAPDEFSLAYSNRHLLNPLRTIANWRLVELRELYTVPAILGAIGVMAYARLIVMNRTLSGAPDGSIPSHAAGH